MAVHDIDYRLIGDDLQIVEIALDPGETVRAEAGAMLYMDADVTMDTGTGGGFMKGLKRRIAGESFFITSFTNDGRGVAKAAFSAPYPGKVVPLDLGEQGGSFLCQKDTFLCAASGIEIEVAFTKKMGAGLFGGEGFILQRLTGDGLAFCHAGGTVIERDLAAGEVLRVDTGCLVAFAESVDYDIEFQGGFKNALFGGEGLFLARVEGPGLVFLQSLPFSRLADRIVAASRMYANKGETNRGGSGALGAIGGLAAGGLLGDLLGGDQ
ncbi:TIGR00266 family protein [Rubrivirga sp. IMCC43871]|uniref:TIGR00266 family protein n=1 Tax=Rubrivirga sp. IMCC43871 TaxID=3391575 RepID=UPI003990039A